MLILRPLKINWIKDYIASIDVAWESTGHKTHDNGQPIPTIRQGLLNLIVRKKERKWNMGISGWT